MNKIHFVIGNIGSGKRAVVSRLLVSLKNVSNNSVSKLSIGSFRSSKVDDFFLEKWKTYCINQIDTHLDLFNEKEHHIITGPLLSVHIVEIIKQFPNSSLYIVKAIDDSFFEDAVAGLDSMNVDKESVDNYNSITTQQLNILINDLNIVWKNVEAPIINADGSINFVENYSTSKIMVAAYNV